MLSAIKKIVPATLKKNLRKRLYDMTKPGHLKESYAQAGEDRILSYIFETMEISNPSYLDIGANDPVFCNNTYLFYREGNTGVCVEADPSIFDYLSKIREKDKCLNIGVTFDDRKEADFYVFPLPSLNTLSKEEAEFREKNGSYKVEKIIKIPLRKINEIIEENFDEVPDLLSIDVEGIDLEILKSINFDKHRPLVICAETITYSENRTEQKIVDILDFVTSKGYFIYADTHINTIFVEEERFKRPNTSVKP
jgi:FkbM family methyltransferase